MSVTINAKGTSVPYFTVGKTGTTIYQGTTDPSLVYTIKNGDYWLDGADNSIKVWGSSAWNCPKLANLTIAGTAGTTISAPATDDIILSTTGVNTKIQFAGDVGPGIITASASQDLYIDPTLGGGGNLILIANQWPTTDGSTDQVLTTNGAGILSFTTINKVGSPAPATTATTGFAYIPVTTGTPTGTPTAITGYAPMVADSGGDKLWVYIGGTWKSATLS